MASNNRRDPERESAQQRRRLAAKQKRQKELQRNLAICFGVVIGLLLIVIAGIKITHGKKEDTTKTAEVNTQGDAANNYDIDEALQQAAVTTTPEPSPEVTPEPTPAAEETPVQETPVEEVPQEAAEQQDVVLYNTAQDTGVDRSNFAVDPNIPCGSDHNNGQKVVYLTIDDGPSYLTQQVLDIFDQYGVKATFFVTAQDPEYFYMIREAYNRGHTIGLHSYTHDYETIYTSVEGYFEDLYRIGAVVEEQIGYIPCFIRFPGGEANMVSADYCVGIMSQLVYEVNARGFQYYNWNISSGDGGNIDDVDVLVANATACDYPNIVLLSHDSGGKEATVAALPQIIEHYLAEGYEFRALDREAFSCHADVRN